MLPSSPPLTLLSVLAHPDDESFGMGGTLALYARRSVAVHLVCATRGEAGTVAPERLEGYASIAELRENELCCAAGKLGLASVNFLGYRDSGMPGSEDNRNPQALAAAPVEEVAQKVAGFIRKLQPQVVITFDPIGGYRHPDHIAMHQATVRAFEIAGDPWAYPGDLPPFKPEKLYFQTMPRRLMRWAVRLLPLFGVDPRRWGLNGDVDLLELVNVDFPIHARINYTPVQALKEEAAACHASQGRMMSTAAPMRWAFRLAAGKEYFIRAYPPPPPGLLERDLFAGVNGAAK